MPKPSSKERKNTFCMTSISMDQLSPMGKTSWKNTGGLQGRPWANLLILKLQRVLVWGNYGGQEPRKNSVQEHKGKGCKIKSLWTKKTRRSWREIELAKNRPAITRHVTQMYKQRTPKQSSKTYSRCSRIRQKIQTWTMGPQDRHTGGTLEIIHPTSFHRERKEGRERLNQTLEPSPGSCLKFISNIQNVTPKWETHSLIKG